MALIIVLKNNEVNIINQRPLTTEEAKNLKITWMELIKKSNDNMSKLDFK